MLEVHLPNLGAMFNLTLTSKDKKWLSREHPSLKISNVSGIAKLSGKLKFDMVYEGKENRYIIFPEKYVGTGVRIKDEYEIKVLFQKGNVSELPQVFETGLRIKNLAKKKKLPPSDLHINGDGSVCLCVASKEKEYFPEGFNIKIFINQLVIPFFYEQTFFRRYGSWPWGEYGHGILGIFESYNEKQKVNKPDIEEALRALRLVSEWDLIGVKFKGKDQIKGHMICFCGRDMKIRECHPTAFAGMWKFKNDLAKFKISLN